MNSKRRRLLAGLGGFIALSATSTAHALTSTPAQTAGPFYPPELPLDDDNDLTQISGHSVKAQGQISDVSGRIVDINGRPLANMRIEIWQCDAHGRYHHPNDSNRRALDPHFQDHGLTHTNTQGQYRFRTIRPVKYPGRTPHIHFAVFPPGEQAFVTQLYVANDVHNDTDYLYNSIPWDKRELVSAAFVPARDPAAELEASFDIILNRSDGTPLQG
jgi:protocatechuate 3,4-dioxygenase, beta subunit